jgi:hypothetical protein
VWRVSAATCRISHSTFSISAFPHSAPFFFLRFLFLTCHFPRVVFILHLHISHILSCAFSSIHLPFLLVRIDASPVLFPLSHHPHRTCFFMWHLCP